MNTAHATETVAHVVVADDDSAIHIERVVEDTGDAAVALWGTEDSTPGVRLAYTYIPEAQLLAALAEAGYTVTRSEP
jgi:hypothetical protein